MSLSSEISAARPRLLGGALILAAAAVAGLCYATWAIEIQHRRFITVSSYFFRRQDMWVLDGYAAALALLGLWAWRLREPRRRVGGGSGGTALLILVGIVVACLLGWLGRTYVFHGYSPSRDEMMVELAGAYLAKGQIGWPIPAVWHPYHRAILPEFYSPYGADAYWTSIYLPVHAAIRALFVRFGAADLAAPMTLAVGLFALWHLARKLLPDRPDARVVCMVMALTSTQLVATAMTPYAMTSHFAFDMLWLALVLRGGRIGHGLAGLVALLAAGLHQWHFPLLFIGPFILWLLASRRWSAVAFHVVVALAMMVVWARLWPMLLLHEVGPPPAVDAARTNGIIDKLVSLFGRLDTLDPMLNNARFVAWNNLLLLPLALLAPAGVRWRSVWRAPTIVLPLVLVSGLGMGFSLYQGYGWGFRYMHGQIGALCLLAGFGWQAVTKPGMKGPGALVAAGSAVTLIAGAWLLYDTERYVRPLARTMAAIRGSKADVVLVDLRGGFYMTDLVRFDEGRLKLPVVMALQRLDTRQLDALCAAYDVAIMDRSQFWPLGVMRISPKYRGSELIQAKRDHLAARNCGRPAIILNRN